MTQGVSGTVPVATAAARSGRKLRLDRAGSKHDRHCRNRKASGGVRPVSGGDINDAYLVTLADGQKVFLKVNSPKNAAFFSAEQEGLAAIRKTNAIGVPEVLASGVFTGDGPAAGRSAASRSKDCSFLIMDYLEAGPRKSDFWERFGRQLAARTTLFAIAGLTFSGSTDWSSSLSWRGSILTRMEEKRC